jgi:hypothetical protein
VSAPEQLHSTEGLSSEEIARAAEEGRLREYLLTPNSPPDAASRLLARLTPDQIVQATMDGTIADLTGRQ